MPGDRPVGDRLRDGPGLGRVPAQLAAGLEQQISVRGLWRKLRVGHLDLGQPLGRAEALGLGYAVVNTDTGHEQDPATILLNWAVSIGTPPVVNASAIIDFCYRAVHQVTVATKQYVEAYYSEPIDRAYIDGCSTGGRQSMVEGTHYPVDCDGLIVGDPAIAASYGGTSTVKQALAFVPTGAWIPYPSTAFPTNPNTVAAADAAVTASCDAVDGVTDGLIQNPAACNILPSALGPSGSGVLTTAQTNALQAYILPVTDATLGQPLFPGMPISDISTSGFEGNSETTFAPPFPTAAEPWGVATRPYATCGVWGRLRGHSARSPSKLMSRRISSLTSTLMARPRVGPRRCRLWATRSPLRRRPCWWRSVARAVRKIPTN
jgi:hypothetical protein